VREREREREMWVFQDCGEVDADTLRVNMISTTLYKSMSRSFVAFEGAGNSRLGHIFWFYLQRQMGERYRVVEEQLSAFVNNLIVLICLIMLRSTCFFIT
jgi:hypothetical protein